MSKLLHRILIPAAAAAVALLASAASAQTYSNSANIAIPTVGVATPYPSPITVSGGPTSIGLMTVTLTNFSHIVPQEVSVMLVGPTGASTILYGRAGGFAPTANATFVFRDGAPPVPSNGTIVSGEFAPTNRGSFSFSPPAPATPTSASLGTFTGSNANGQWRLYVQDFIAGDGGSIAGGWSMSFAPAVAAQDSTFTYQGKLDSGAASVNGAADFRFSLWSSASLPAGQIGATIARNALPVTDGLFTSSLDFGFGVVDNKQLFLQTEVRSPAGSGAFTTLLPRQPLTAALNAQFARKAALADSATTATNAATATNATNATNAVNAADVIGRVQVTTGTLAAPNILAFGPFTGSSENTDPMGIYRANTATDISELRIQIGDNTSTFTDSLVIGVAPGSTWTPVYNFFSSGVAQKAGGGSWAALSDPRKKHDIAPLTGTLDKVLQLRGYSFVYNDDAVAAHQGLPGTQIGLMADEVARIFPDWVTANNEGTRFVTERSTTALMVEALRDLRAEKDRQIETLNAEAVRREAEAMADRREIDELGVRLAALEAALARVTKDK